MFERVRYMLVKEFIQVFRDPRMARVIFVAPMIQLIVFGYAANTDVRHVTTALYDLDNTPASRELAARFVKSGYFDVVEHVNDDRRMSELLDLSAVQAVLRMNRGFADQLRLQSTATAQLILDGTDSNTAGIILNYAAQIVQGYSQDVQIEQLSRLTGQRPQPAPVELRPRAWFNENLVSRNFYVPGVIANISMLVTLLLTSMAVVREKEIGTIEQIMVSPIRPFEFILGKCAPFALIAVADIVMILLVGILWFRVPMRGSIVLLMACACLFLLTTLGAGLFISTICGTQQQAMMTTFFYFFPALLLSGFIFPIQNMPEPVQWVTYANPLRYFLVILRGIFLKGIGLSVLWPQVTALGALGVATFWLATTRFKKTMQ